MFNRAFFTSSAMYGARRVSFIAEVILEWTASSIPA
jgi:hypothetical protein